MKNYSSNDHFNFLIIYDLILFLDYLKISLSNIFNSYPGNTTLSQLVLIMEYIHALLISSVSCVLVKINCIILKTFICQLHLIL